MPFYDPQITRGEVDTASKREPHSGPVRAVFLDAGLTLIYSDLPLAERISAVAAERGLLIPLGLVTRALPAAQAALFRAHRDDPDLWSSDDRVHQLWLDFYRSVLHHAGADAAGQPAGDCAAAIYAEYNAPGAWKLYEDVLPALEELHNQDYVIGVISDWGSTLPARVLLPLGIGKYISFMVVSTIVRHAKPGRELYSEALARACVAPHEAVHVGDNYVNDVLGARAAGIQGIFLDRPNHHTFPLDCPRITTLTELPGLLARLTKAR